jgi:hypothetical protein
VSLAVPRGGASTEQRTHAWHIAQYGIDLCRRGQWQGGIAQLAALEATKGDDPSVPGLALTYLGYGLAYKQNRIADGIRLCRAGVDRESWRVENHLNLARTYLLAGSVRRAIAALEYGLSLDPEHTGMLTLRLSLGMRRPPPISFLHRSHPLNRIVGKIRHRISISRSRMLEMRTVDRATHA